MDGVSLDTVNITEHEMRGLGEAQRARPAAAAQKAAPRNSRGCKSLTSRRSIDHLHEVFGFLAGWCCFRPVMVSGRHAAPAPARREFRTLHGSASAPVLLSAGNGIGSPAFPQADLVIRHRPGSVPTLSNWRHTPQPCARRSRQDTVSVSIPQEKRLAAGPTPGTGSRRVRWLVIYRPARRKALVAGAVCRTGFRPPMPPPQAGRRRRNRKAG